MPHGGGVLHDEESGDGLVVWVDRERITEQDAQQLEADLNAAALARGRRLTPAEVLELVPFVV